MSIRFMRTTEPLVPAAFMAGLLTAALADGRTVVWLLSGGSGMAAEVVAHRLVRPELRRRLVVMQVDERYGPVGHADSNWQQLAAAGLQLTDGETGVPVLTGANFDETVRIYNAALAEQFDRADVRIGFFGMGADGHAAGILPHSSALDSQKLVAGYQGPDFQRITMTAAAIARLDEAVLFAAGAGKRAQLEALQHEAPPAEQPAQLLKRAKALTVCNDAVGENI